MGKEGVVVVIIRGSWRGRIIYLAVLWGMGVWCVAHSCMKARSGNVPDPNEPDTP